jgi:DNA-binding NtrC family response regulator
MGKKLILLVESDMNLQQSVLLMLQRAGHFITATDSACEALEILRSDKYHLLISDLDTPEIRNMLIPEVLDSYPALSLVILTDQSVADVELEEQLIRPRYLSKPIDPEYILNCVEDILGGNNHQSRPNPSYNSPFHTDIS